MDMDLSNFTSCFLQCTNSYYIRQHNPFDTARLYFLTSKFGGDIYPTRWISAEGTKIHTIHTATTFIDSYKFKMDFQPVVSLVLEPFPKKLSLPIPESKAEKFHGDHCRGGPSLSNCGLSESAISLSCPLPIWQIP